MGVPSIRVGASRVCGVAVRWYSRRAPPKNPARPPTAAQGPHASGGTRGTRRARRLYVAPIKR